MPAYSGGRFELLDGGGDRADTRDSITANDLVATSFLSVDIPGWVALRILEGNLGREVNSLLRQIPTDVRIGSDEAQVLLSGAALKAWQTLCTKGSVAKNSAGYGIAGVTVSKLLARKRPGLIPVTDSIMRCALGRPKNLWDYHQRSFQSSGEELRRALDIARGRAGIDGRVSHLRLLDVIVWMRHREDHGLGRCRTPLSLPRQSAE